MPMDMMVQGWSMSNIVKLIQPAEFSDPLTEVLHEGARALLAQAVEAEVTAFPQRPCRQTNRRRPPTAGAPWPSARARDHNRPWPGRECAARALQDIWMAETKKDALDAFDAFRDLRGQVRQGG